MYLHVMKFSLLILLASCSSVAQNSSDIVRIEFTSLTRGYHETVIITNNSLKISKSQVSEPKIDKARMLKKEEWADIVKALQKVTLAEVSELKSPTMKRAYDGARHSTITITTKTNQVYAHTFDDQEPHQMLMPLMKALQKKRL
jgi:hypothetical protein